MSPTYEFQCSNEECGSTFEEKLRVEDRDLLVGYECSACSIGTIKRIISPTSFTINGYSAKNGYSSHIGDTEGFKIGQAEEASGKPIKRV